METPGRQRIGWGTCLFLLMMSVIGGLVCWYRSVRPLWVDEDRAFSPVCGITADGQLASLESSTRLSIRNLETGVIAKGFDIPKVNDISGAVTDDGKWILLVTARPELLVVSLEDGRLRYPPISIPDLGSPVLRQDARYAIISSAVGGVNSLVDLSGGKVLWTTKSRLSFCGTYQDLVVASDSPSFSNPRLVTISDQKDLGAIAVPNITGHQLQDVRQFVDDRILMAYAAPWRCRNVDFKCFSGRISDKQLVDIREEPLLYARYEGDRYVLSLPEGQLRVRDLGESASGRRLMKLYEFGLRHGLIREWKSQQYSFQATVSGRPVGPEIALKDLAAHPTKDGRYLVECGTRLAVFPISRRSRWPETLAVVALPWLLVAAWRTVRKRRAHSPSLAGSQPVQ